MTRHTSFALFLMNIALYLYAAEIPDSLRSTFSSDSIEFTTRTFSPDKYHEHRKASRRKRLKSLIYGKRRFETISEPFNNRLRGKLQYCYHKKLRENPRLTGWVVFCFSVAGDGSVLSCNYLQSQLDDDTFNKELCDIILNFNFGKIDTPDTTKVIRPFHFGS